jgi:tRNA pseudouridine55 synthase
MNFTPDTLELVCECAKGTYIRVLGEDLARALGTLGHLTRLRRTWVEPFRGLPMVSLEAALAGAENAQGLLAADVALQGLPEARLAEAQVAVLRNGQAVRCGSDPVPAVGARVRLYGPGGLFLGLAEAQADGWLQPRRLLHLHAT